MATALRSFALPADWAARGFALRGETAGDEPFLERLFVSVRAAELEAMGWPEETMRTFLASQFAFQNRHYGDAYAGADFGIVVHDGDPVGRLYLFRSAGEVRLVDVSLLPEWRGGGLGTALLRGVQAEAAAEGRTVSLHVDMTNPAQNLYRRLGFAETGTHGPSWHMVWRPGTAPRDGVGEAAR